MKVALYARVSKGEQDVASQMARLRAEAEARGDVVVLGLTDEISSRKRLLNRERILALARGRQFQGVMVEALDRWGRSVRDLTNTVGDLREAGCSFEALRERIVLRAQGVSATDDYVFNSMAAAAQLERDLISERTRKKLESLKAAGKRLGAVVVPCHDCGGARPKALRGLRRGRLVPLCAACKAKPPSSKGGRPRKGPYPAKTTPIAPDRQQMGVSP